MFRPKPEKNPFKEKRRKTFIVGIIIIIIATVSGYFYFNKKEEPLSLSYPICNFDQEEIIDYFKDYNYHEKQLIEDYFFYGETMSLFDQEYEINGINKLLGKTLILYDICSQKEYFYLIDKDVDGQVPLDQLPQGFYEVFVNVDMVKKRVIIKDQFKESINLIRRNKESTKVKLISDKNMFDDGDHKNYLNDNYLFLDVSKTTTNQDYDIVLDPDYAINVTGWYENFGPLINGKLAADELLELAELIKVDLEAEGLKVLLLRNKKDKIINLYGENGRLDRAYDSKAKYYISLGFDTSTIGGLKVYHSSFSSIRFASAVATNLIEATNLQAANNTGVYRPLRYNGLDGNMTIRESGGKALAAATFSDLAIEGNFEFAFNNPYGLQTIYIQYINTNNHQELLAWENNKKEYAKATAQALIEALNVNLGDNNDLSN